MKTLRVELGERSYPIYIGTDLLTQGELIKPHLTGNQVLIVSNETVAPLYLEKLQSALTGIPHKVLILPDGEIYKTLETANKIYTALLEHRFNRNCTLIALGGGVIGDITGFAAASYQRGVAFIQVPTTLLAQVDSSVGGKTGVNHPLGKNMIGAFHQPQCVLADTSTLNTLADNQLASGIAEVIKYGLIRDPEFLQWIEQHIDDIRNRNPQALSYAIERSCQNKADVVAADELEGGQRALLNLGHTFGHAIETGMGYGTWLHGEAVATGILMAADLSARQGWISQQDVTRIRKLLLASRLPIKSPHEMGLERFMELMSVDKKVLNGVLRLILLKSMGHAIISDDFNPQYLQQTLSEI